MSLTFYYAPMTRATRPHWALEELEVPYEKRKMSLEAGDQKKPEYLALNPNGRVPLLVVDGTPIFESLAILIYLGETYGVDKGLYPPPGPQRGEVLKWMIWTAVTLEESVIRLLRNTSDRFPAEERNEKAGETARRDIAELLGIADRALEGKEYLVGGKFSFADLALTSMLPFMARFGVDLSPYQNVSALLGRCSSRPALARVMTGG